LDGSRDIMGLHKRTEEEALNTMKKMRWLPVFLMMALLSAPLFAATNEAAQCEWTNVDRIVAVGDVHSDYGQLVKCLRAAEVIDNNNAWIGGNTHLVQTGDKIGRGSESRKVLDLFMDLEAQAAKAGGAVHCLMGNHEAFLLSNYFDYLPPDDVKTFGGREELVKAVSPEGKYGKWIRGHDAIIRIDDILFAHAGLTSDEKGKTLQDINAYVRKTLAGTPSSSDINMPVLWTRALAVDDDEDVKRFIEPILEKLGAKHLIIGHTPQKGRIRPRAGGLVIQIDVGMCAVFGGPAMCLVIEKGKFYQVSDKKKEELKMQAGDEAKGPPKKNSETRP
jgi:hypothetical protein